MIEYGMPSTEVRETETWWWIQPPRRPGGPSQGYGTTEALARRAQRIYGGHVEVIRQRTVTTTIITVEQGEKP